MIFLSSERLQEDLPVYMLVESKPNNLPPQPSTKPLPLPSEVLGKGIEEKCRTTHLAVPRSSREWPNGSMLDEGGAYVPAD
jgi:hypothetical protein